MDLDIIDQVLIIFCLHNVRSTSTSQNAQHHNFICLHLHRPFRIHHHCVSRVSICISICHISVQNKIFSKEDTGRSATGSSNKTAKRVQTAVCVGCVSSPRYKADS